MAPRASMSVPAHELTSVHGGRFAWTESGDPAGPTAVCLHGTPGHIATVQVTGLVRESAGLVRENGRCGLYYVFRSDKHALEPRPTRRTTARLS